MKYKIKRRDNIVRQLHEQGFSYELIDEADLGAIERLWRDKFIKGPRSTEIGKYKWHVFSYEIKDCFKGEDAIAEYQKQYPTDIVIFNETIDFGLRCKKTDRLPTINQGISLEDIYICQSNMKWTYVIPHEVQDIGTYFCYG